MITVALIGNDELYAGGLDDFSISLDEEHLQIKVYYKDVYIGDFKSVCGITDDEFISKIKYKEN